MKTLGLPISRKENEKRRALVPRDIARLSAPSNVYIERSYGEVLGISDEAYEKMGCRICNHREVLNRDILCDPKIGDVDYLSGLRGGQILFGWIHAMQNRAVTDDILQASLTAYAWEKMFDCGRHIFWRNNELAGEAAIMHAFQCYGRMPYGLRVAVIGKGNTARGAARVLNMLGATVVQYDRRTERLLCRELGDYDAVVNCVLWDVKRKSHILTRADLTRMQPGALIVDVSCDRHGAIETCRPTTIEEPVYQIDGITHYAVDHTPSLFHRTFTYENSEIIAPYLEMLMTDQPNDVLQNSLIIADGVIVDEEIKRHQNRP